MAAIDKGEVVLDHKTVILVDEAGMAPLTAIADLVRRSDEVGSKIVLVGDVRQLKSVASGAPMRALGAELGYAELISIRRQRHDWMREASMELAAHRPDRAVEAYDRAGQLVVHADRTAALQAAADDYLRLTEAIHSPERLQEQLLITPRNRDVAEFNRLVRTRLQATGRLGPDLAHIRVLPRGRIEKSEPVEIPLAVGDRVVFGARLELGSRTIINSDVGRILAIDVDGYGDDPRLTFVLDRTDDGGMPMSFMVRYRQLISKFSEAGVPQLQHAYAMTVHGAQGATVNRAILVDIEGCSVEAAYVGMTRHREQLSIHISAEKSLSRNRREVVRLSRGNRMIDDTGPETPTMMLTNDERNAAIAFAMARMRRPQPDPNPSFHVYDRAAWLAAADPIKEFKRQCERHGGRGGGGRLEPEAPVIIGVGDATKMSRLETARLNAIPLTSEAVRTAYGLQAMPDGSLRHDASGNTVAIEQGLPYWTTAQRETLTGSRSISDHPLVQMAVLILKKPLRWARAWVRRTFGFQGLNPLAASAHHAERQARKRMDANETAANRASITPSVVLDSGSMDARRRRRVARWEAMKATTLNADPTITTANQRRAEHIRREKRLERWASIESSSAQSAQPSLGPDQEHERAKRQQNRFGRWTSLDGSLSQGALPDTGQTQRREKAGKRRDRFERWAVLDAASDPSADLSVSSFEPAGGGETAVTDIRGQRSDAPPPPALVPGLGEQAASAAPLRDAHAASAAVPPPDEDNRSPAALESAIAVRGALEPRQSAERTASAQKAEHHGLDSKALMVASKRLRIECLEELHQAFSEARNAARGNPLDRRTWGDDAHIARVNALAGEYAALKQQVQDDFSALLKLQISDLKSARRRNLAQYESETKALASLFRPLVPTVERPFKRDLPHATSGTSNRGLPSAQAETLLAMVLAVCSKNPSLPLIMKLVTTVEPYVAVADTSTRAFCARALVKAQSHVPEAVDANTVKIWAENAGGLAPAAADALLIAVAELGHSKHPNERGARYVEASTTMKGRDPSSR